MSILFFALYKLNQLKILKNIHELQRFCYHNKVCVIKFVASYFNLTVLHHKMICGQLFSIILMFQIIFITRIAISIFKTKFEYKKSKQRNQKLQKGQVRLQKGQAGYKKEKKGSNFALRPICTIHHVLCGRDYAVVKLGLKFSSSEYFRAEQLFLRVLTQCSSRWFQPKVERQREKIASPENIP